MEGSNAEMPSEKLDSSEFRREISIWAAAKQRWGGVKGGGEAMTRGGTRLGLIDFVFLFFFL
jgi:hypothetical protein